MTSYRVYYSQQRCIHFMEPSWETLAINESNAQELFYLSHDRNIYKVNHVLAIGLFNNNGRYSKQFKTTTV